MRRGLDTRSARRGYLVRGVAVFFVLFVFVDLAFPQLCQEAADGIPGRIHATAQAAGREPDATDRAGAVQNSEDSRDGQHPEQAPHEEDCFGCCGHVLPGTEFPGLKVVEIVSLPTPPVYTQVPTPSLRNPYHPPRIS
jgi:hypothetical protein